MLRSSVLFSYSTLVTEEYVAAACYRILIEKEQRKMGKKSRRRVVKSTRNPRANNSNGAADIVREAINAVTCPGAATGDNKKVRVLYVPGAAGLLDEAVVPRARKETKSA